MIGRSLKMKVTINKKVYQYQNPLTLMEIKDDLKVVAFAAKVNNRLRELTYLIERDSEIEFLTLDDKDVARIYEASLRYVIFMAFKRLYPKGNLKFNFSISRSTLAIPKVEGVNFLDKEITEIETEAKKIIAADLPIKRMRMNIDEAIKYYRSHGYYDKIEILKYRQEDYVNIYQCQDYFNYMFSYMVPSTGYLKEFKLRNYFPGFLIQYPRSETEGHIPDFEDAPIFNQTIKEAAKWGKIIDGDTIARINEYVNNNQEVEFVNMCETKHNQQLAKLGDDITENADEIRLIAIAGPSSSGKTTFSIRLKVELLSRGIKPIMISIDDYYRSKSEAPLDQFGKPDLEHINALDVELFNEHMLKLIAGEEITLPKYNFKKAMREDGPKLKIDQDTIIIIEGIHALNDLLTPSISHHQKYKIFIAPQTQLHIDDHNPISFTDLRLLRRMVRDQQFRNAPAEETIEMWPSVRKGEFKWIYPFQEQANFVFNSELTYEFLVLKKHAYKSLESIHRNSKYFIDANRLLKFLKYFKEIDDDLVPNNSILREFIGDSIFHK